MAMRPRFTGSVSASMSAPAQQDGWMWDGANWVCGEPCPPPGPPPCPPPGWPQPCPPFYPPPSNQAPWYPGANGGVSFSQTAPPNPVRGHFWYDGHVLWMFDGAAWVDVGVAGISSLALGGAPVFVGITAPPGSAPGALWWNGTVLQLWDGTSWKVIGPTAGSAAGPMIGVNFYGSSQIITIPLAATRALAQMWGASGGSGGMVTGGGSGGTGSGGYLVKFLTGLIGGNTLNFTQAAGGVAGGTNSAGGNAGVTTLVSGTQTIGTLTCNGSNGSPNANNGTSTGTAGGTATGGDINMTGQSGSAGTVLQSGGILAGNWIGVAGHTVFAAGADGVGPPGSGNPGNPGGLMMTWYA